MINERNEGKYEIKKENKTYHLSTSIIDNKIKFVCEDFSKNQLFKGEFNNNELRKMRQYFKYNNLDQIQMNFIDIIKKQRVNIVPSLSIIFFFNDEKVVLPLRKIISNNNAYGGNQLNNQNNIFPQSFNRGFLRNHPVRFNQNAQLSNGNNNAFNNNHQNNIDYQKQISLLNKDMNELKNLNEEITEINHFLEKENGQLEAQVEQLTINNDILLNQSQRLNEKKIKDLEKSLENKEKDLVVKNMKISELNTKIQQLENLINTNNNQDLINELLKKLELKEKEIKEIKSRYPLELSKGEKLMSIIFQSHDFKFTRSFLCKNTDQFTKLESLLYKEYPEYLENDAENYFLVNGRKIYRYKSLEENGIHNSDIIILNKIDN
jgi:hypothetical protein